MEAYDELWSVHKALEGSYGTTEYMPRAMYRMALKTFKKIFIILFSLSDYSVTFFGQYYIMSYNRNCLIILHTGGLYEYS